MEIDWFGTTHPWSGADKEAAILGAVHCGHDGDDGDGVDEEPDADDEHVQDAVGQLVPPHEREVGVDGNGGDKAAGGQVTGRDKQALGEASRGADADPAVAEPLGAEEEGHALVHVGEKEVEDEDEELIRRLSLPERRQGRLVVVFHACVGPGAARPATTTGGGGGMMATYTITTVITADQLPIAVLLLGKDAVDAQCKVDPVLQGARLVLGRVPGRGAEVVVPDELVGQVEEEQGGREEGHKGEDADGDEALPVVLVHVERLRLVSQFSRGHGC